MKKLVRNAGILAGSMAVSVGAMAQEAGAVDVSGAVATITSDATGAVTAIGVAMLGLAGVAIAFKWAKAAIFG